MELVEPLIPPGKRGGDKRTVCQSAWGPDADRHSKSLINMTVEGAFISADLHLDSAEPDERVKSTRTLHIFARDGATHRRIHQFVGKDV